MAACAGHPLQKRALVVVVVVVVVVLGFYVPPTAKVIWRRDLGLKFHPKDLKRALFQIFFNPSGSKFSL